MKLIAIEKELPDISPNAFTNTLKKSEAARVWELYQSGKLREIYFRQDRPDAVLILECNSMEECQTILASLPLVKPGFSRLFSVIDDK
jgi:muconolactone delta-isomerase